MTNGMWQAAGAVFFSVILAAGYLGAVEDMVAAETLFIIWTYIGIICTMLSLWLITWLIPQNERSHRKFKAHLSDSDYFKRRLPMPIIHGHYITCFILCLIGGWGWTAFATLILYLIVYCNNTIMDAYHEEIKEEQGDTFIA